MTWADDPESNYKKQVEANMYEAQDMPSTENAADQFYVNQPNVQQQQQHQQQEYPTADENGATAVVNESPHYQYDTTNQYDDGQYQYHEQADQTQEVGANDGYYYGGEQMNQYDQYETQPTVEPQQQEVSISLSSVLLAGSTK